MSDRMPWGKYRDRPIGDVPSGYLVWALEESDIAEPYRTAIREELADRLDLPAPPADPTPMLPPAELEATFRTMLKLGYKTLSLKYHPDRGGDTVVMQRINQTADWARAQGLL